MSSKNNIKKFLKKIIPFKYDLDVRESIQDVIKNKSEYLSSDTNLSNKEKNILENILSIKKTKAICQTMSYFSLNANPIHQVC